MKRLRIGFSVLALALVFCQTASAHFLWLVTETAGKPAKVKVYFAEAAEPDAPELLDKVTKSEVFSIGGMGRRSEPKVITVKKGEDALEGELPAGATTVILRHTYGAMERGGQSFLLKYYAKAYTGAVPGNWPTVKDEDRLPLEIIPKLDGSSLTLRVTWKGEPVKGAVVTIGGPGVTKLEPTTDEAGMCKVDLPQAGLYSFRTKHVEATKGEFEGTAYGEVRSYSTLALNYVPSKLVPETSALPALPKPTTSFGGAIVGDHLYVYGGNYGGAHEYVNEDQSGDLWSLDLKNPSKWEQLAGGPKLVGLAMVEYKGKLYRVGGFTALNKGGEKQNIVSQSEFACYDPATKAWTSLPALPQPRSSADAAMVGDTLYVVGGWALKGQDNETQWHDSALACNLAAEKLEWKQIAVPPFKRRALALAAHQGKLYCLGGMQEQGGTTMAVSIYDPANNTWAEGPALMGSGMDAFGTSAFACNGSLYATTMSGSVQRLAGDKWEYVGHLAHPRFFHRLLPWQDEKLVIVGGASMTVGKIDALEVLSVGTVKTAAK